MSTLRQASAIAVNYQLTTLPQNSKLKTQNSKLKTQNSLTTINYQLFLLPSPEAILEKTLAQALSWHLQTIEIRRIHL
jgi:hypothetical protein